MTAVAATVPYAWPYDGVVDPQRLALVVAGAQVAWAARSMRADEVSSVVLDVAGELRSAGALVVLLRHGAPPGRCRESPLPPAIGNDDWGLVLPVHPDDVVVDATGIDGFHASALDDVLRARGCDHLLLGGFGYEAAVDSTLRSANDRGYECLVLTDGVAPFDDDVGARALATVTMSGGIFGALGTSSALLGALRSPTAMEAVS